MDMMYPAFLKLNGSRVVVIGAGPVAERKIGPLLEAGADVTVVAPEATERIRAMDREGSITWKCRVFRRSDVKNRALVIAATGDVAVSARVYKLASRRGALVNSVDDPANCNFYVPAIVRRDPLIVAVSSSGRAPSFSKQLRRFLDRKLYAGIGADIEQLGKIRDEVLAESEGHEQIERSDRIGEAQKITMQSILDRIEKA